MTLRDKGERNLKIAKLLDSKCFLKLSGLPKEHLCSVIINRLYYGVFLIAKGKLLENRICKPTDRFDHSGKNGVWNKLRNENCFNELGLAGQLRSIRNRMDYEKDDMENNNELAKAKEITDELYQALKEIK